MRIDTTAKILFLATPDNPHNDNHERLPRYFQERNWQVTSHKHDDLSLFAGNKGPGQPISPENSDNIQLFSRDLPLTEFDIIWPIGLGPAQTYADRMNLLNLLPSGKTISNIQAINALHGKTPWLDFAPESFISTQPQQLAEKVKILGGEWVLKPNAGSFGRDVIRVNSPEDVLNALSPGNSQAPSYWLLQRYIPEIAQGETRTLICGAQILGSYLRHPAAHGITNLAQGGHARATQLGEADTLLVKAVQQKLLEAGINFAAIDTAGGYLVETNIANPGGLQTMAELYDHDHKLGDQLVAEVSVHFAQGSPAT